MQITMTSLLTGKVHTREVPVTPEQLASWKAGALIQDACSDLSPEDREFLMSGATPEEELRPGDLRLIPETPWGGLVPVWGTPEGVSTSEYDGDDYRPPLGHLDTDAPVIILRDPVLHPEDYMGGRVVLALTGVGVGWLWVNTVTGYGEMAP